MTWKQRLFNLPNRLTLFRIIFTLFFLCFIFKEDLYSKIVAFLIFSVASLTDLYDGYMARKLNMVTDFGKLIDPIADKILIFSCFLAFLEMRLISSWMVIIILFREIVITAFRLYALRKKQVIPADRIGKHKLVSQVFAIYCILVSLIVKDVFVFAGVTNSGVDRVLGMVIFAAMLVTVVLTLISGVAYIWRNRSLIEI